MSDFTENQRRAIAQPGNVLVVAGAGTGKTRTLVRRCVDWLLAAPGERSVDQVLLVTFTDAAASEIRQRIRDELKGHLEASPESEFIAEQIALLDTAFICTIHSFCFRLIRQHFYELELDPQLTVLPAEEAKLLAEDTLNRIFKRHYQGRNSDSLAVQSLIQSVARGWELPVRRLVGRVHAYAQTLPNSDGWFAEQVANFSSEAPSRWREWLKEAIDEWVNGWIPILEMTGAGIPNITQCLDALRALPVNPSLEQAREAFECIDAAFGAKWPHGTVSSIRDRLKDFSREAKALLGFTARSDLPETSPNPVPQDKDSASASNDALLQDWTWVRKQMLALLQLTIEFGDEFGSAKRELGVVDFHDLEQFSLRLLWDPLRQGPTPLAEAWRKKLRLICVDEYQDINAAQDTILQSLAREGTEANRFLVGDPKQSIYRFRLAAPQIFQQYIRTWKNGSGLSQVIPLTENFRSGPMILECVNRLFSSLMRRELGGVEYDETAWLKFGRAESQSPGIHEETDDSAPSVELHLRLSGIEESEEELDEESESSLNDSLSSAEAEARLVGVRLALLRSERHLVWDPVKKTRRPVEWSDMVVLLRSPRMKAEAYAKEFSRLGIPLSASRGGFLASSEVMDLLSLLQLLDNPLQDLPLLAVLRSPLAGLTVDELALVRLASKGKLWTALQHYSRKIGRLAGHIVPDEEKNSGREAERSAPDKLTSLLGNPLLRPSAESAGLKINRFLKHYRHWRRLARQSSLVQCLDRVLEETQYYSFLLTQSSGIQRRANIKKLLSWAAQFDRCQRQGLFRFLRFVDAQKEAEIDHDPAPPETRNAVQLMSIHQSKGLEFRVVVAADLGKQFNFQDLKGNVILDERFGLCPLVKPPFTEQRYPSVAHWLAQRHQRRETIGEEMRLLYVAMTRACDLLLLVGSSTKSATDRWKEKDTVPFSLRQLAAAKNYLDWIGPWMSTAAGDRDWVERANGRATEIGMRWFVYGSDFAAEVNAPSHVKEPRAAIPKAVEPKAMEALVNRLNWEYPFEIATQERAKTSVSSFRLGLLEELGVEKTELRKPILPLTKGAGAKVSKLSAAEIGLAHHRFLQFVDLEKALTIDHLKTEALRMEAAGILSTIEMESLNLPAIAGFWQSAVGQQIFSRGADIRRELAFTFKLTLREIRELRRRHRDLFQIEVRSAPSEFNSSDSRCDARVGSFLDTDFVTVTGVVDLAVLSSDEIWLVDFKTDSVTLNDWKSKINEYEPQMELYALALGRIYRRPVTHRWLHFLAVSETVSCGSP